MLKCSCVGNRVWIHTDSVLFYTDDMGSNFEQTRDEFFPDHKYVQVPRGTLRQIWQRIALPASGTVNVPKSIATEFFSKLIAGEL